jgi:preprotein translocase subunit SecE
VEVKPMEVKKTQQPAAAASSAEAAQTKRKAQDFLGDIKAEISKITWTSREELQVYTKIVVAATFIFGIGIYVIDLLIQTFLNSLSAIVRLISG